MAIVTPINTPPGARRRLKITSPSTLEPIGDIEVQTEEDVRAAVNKARQAQQKWGALSYSERGKYVLKARDILVKHQDEFIATIRRETPKPVNDVLMMDIIACCDALHYYAKKTARILRTEKKPLHGPISMLFGLRIIYQPLGVVGIISPWNGPFVLSLVPTVQALMAGNTVLLKPSSATPFSGKLIGDMFEEAGLPEGVFTVLLGDSDTGNALIEAGVNKISFTGSVETGREVAVACARQLIPCTLELGGKDPMIVCADADLDVAADGAVGGSLINTGQYCCGTERVYVVEAVADEFIKKVVERVSTLRQGSDGEFDVGAIFTTQQLEIIERQIAEAVEKGAKVLAGGRRNPELKGLYFEPTVITDVSHDMLIMREETFGPVIPIMRVRDEEEAIRLANDTRYGLAANVWSSNEQKAFEIAKRIEAGSVTVNHFTSTYGIAEAPFGGCKDSGVGRVNGEIGLKGYCHIKPIIIDLTGGKGSARQYPVSDDADEILKGIVSYFWGTPEGCRMSLQCLAQK